ncbi:threonylcarbamoyl-AMP synthase [mine drainage metagenome]|uniref:Threonylcarbamoyl-AMP synthase n=1 Tax=mine drainage metagenome TaxID=410659 RepID=A0A1J5RBK3_9ZZZZ
MNEQIARAAALLRAGELVAFPTETVYGLGADASNPQAVAKIFAAKGRPADHPLIVHIAGVDKLDAWAREVPDAARALAAAFWPGPLTLILKRSGLVPDAVTGGQDTVGLRVPNHPLALALLAEFGGGVAAPSANRFGRISPTTAAHVRAELGDAVPLVVDGGPCAVGIESTIVDLSRGAPVVLRPGAISADDIMRVLGSAPEEATSGESPRVSGSLAAHYAPSSSLRLVVAAELEAAAQDALAQGLRVAVLCRCSQPFAAAELVWHTAPDDPAGYAHELYAALRQLDAIGPDLILVEAPPQEPAWRAVADRLARAARGSGEQDET